MSRYLALKEVKCFILRIFDAIFQILQYQLQSGNLQLSEHSNCSLTVVSSPFTLAVKEASRLALQSGFKVRS